MNSGVYKDNPSEGFQDEPDSAAAASGKKKKKFLGKKGGKKPSRPPPPSHTYRIEGIEDAFTKDEMRRQRRRRRRQKRLERLGKLTVLLCCCGLIAAIVIVPMVIAEVGRWAAPPPPPTAEPTQTPYVAPTDAPVVTPAPVPPPPTKAPVPTDAPTKAPTKSPTLRPTKSPTKSPAPTAGVHDSYELAAIQDTTIHENGFHVNKAFGGESTFLVQHGPSNKETIPDTFALLKFDTSEVPSFDRLKQDGKKAVLKLTHKVLALDDQNRPAAKITVSRMPSTPQNLELLTGGIFSPDQFWDGPTHEVATTATNVEIDISDLVWNDPFDDDQIFLMLQNRGMEQEAGDEFYSRESDETPPTLVLSDVKP